jgi:hypothetical protein
MSRPPNTDGFCRMAGVAAALALLLNGCGTAGEGGDRRPGTPPRAPARTATRASGPRVVKIHPDYGYAVIECAALPSAGEEARVYRNGRPVGIVRFTGRARPPFVIADIVSGDLSRGDQIRFGSE